MAVNLEEELIAVGGLLKSVIAVATQLAVDIKVANDEIKRLRAILANTGTNF